MDVLYLIVLISIIIAAFAFEINRNKGNEVMKLIVSMQALFGVYSKEVIKLAESALEDLNDTLSANNFGDFQASVIENIAITIKNFFIEKLEEDENPISNIVLGYLKTNRVETVFKDLTVQALSDTEFFVKLEDKYDDLVEKLEQVEEKLEDLSK